MNSCALDFTDDVSSAVRDPASWKERLSSASFTIGSIIVLSVTAVTPWLFGGVDVHVQRWILAALGLALICRCIRLGSRHDVISIPAATVPLMLLLLLGVVQLIPFPPPINTFLSPIGSELQCEVSALPSDQLPSPVSLYPTSTRRDLTLLVLIISSFACGAFFFSKPQRSYTLCLVVALNGALLSLFGIVQQQTYNGRLYWVKYLSEGGQPFASFVNRNHAGNYLNLCLAATLGIIVIRSLHGRRDPIARQDGDADGMSTLSLLSSTRFDSVFRFMLSSACLVLVGILCSGSRGAILSCVVGVIVVLSAAGRRSAITRTLVSRLGIAFLIGCLGTVVLGRADHLVRRFTGHSEVLNLASEPRFVHWQDAISAVPDFWFVGAGLGTYRFVYQLYEKHDIGRWYRHAENEPLELLIECGAVGLGLLAVAVASMAMVYLRLIRSEEKSTFTAGVGMVGLFALTSQVTHSLFDFGVHIPAIAMLLAVLCGSAAGHAGEKYLRNSWLAWSLLALLLTAVTWAITEASHIARFDTAFKQTNVVLETRQPAQVDIDRASGELERALEDYSSNAEGQYALAALYVKSYRNEVFRRFVESPRQKTSRNRLWELTSTLNLHRRAARLNAEADTDGLSALKNDATVNAYLVPALERLHLANAVCGLLPRVHLRLAELSFLEASPRADEVHLQRARKLAPAEANVLFQCGLLEYQSGRFGMAFADWKRCLSLSPKNLDQIVQLSIARLNTSELLEQVMPASPKILVRLAHRHFSEPELIAARRLTGQRAAKSLNREHWSDNEYFALRGAIRRLQDQPDDAISDYRRAVMLNSSNTRLRFELAELLSEVGHTDDARRHARICVDMAPRNQRYRKFWKKLARSS